MVFTAQVLPFIWAAAAAVARAPMLPCKTNSHTLHAESSTAQETIRAWSPSQLTDITAVTLPTHADSHSSQKQSSHSNPFLKRPYWQWGTLSDGPAAVIVMASEVGVAVCSCQIWMPTTVFKTFQCDIALTVPLPQRAALIADERAKLCSARPAVEDPSRRPEEMGAGEDFPCRATSSRCAAISLLLAAAVWLQSTAHLSGCRLLCRSGSTRGQVLRQLPLPLHEWPLALGACILTVQGVYTHVVCKQQLPHLALNATSLHAQHLCCQHTRLKCRPVPIRAMNCSSGGTQVQGSWQFCWMAAHTSQKGLNQKLMKHPAAAAAAELPWLLPTAGVCCCLPPPVWQACAVWPGLPLHGHAHQGTRQQDSAPEQHQGAKGKAHSIKVYRRAADCAGAWLHCKPAVGLAYCTWLYNTPMLGQCDAVAKNVM